MNRFIYVCFALTLVCSLFCISGCEKPQDSESDEKASSPTSEASEPEGNEDGDDEKALLNAERDWEPCDIMPPEVVADTFGVPKDEIETQTIATCVQRWKSEDEKTILETELGNFFVKEKPSRAMRFFENATRQTTKKQARAEREKVKERTKKKIKEEETDNVETKKKGADAVVDAIGGGEKKFEEVEGLGDRARINTRNGDLYVVEDNLLFRVSAWHGPPSGEKTAKSMEAMKKAKAAHIEKNYEKQKEQTIKLATAILKHVDTLR